MTKTAKTETATTQDAGEAVTLEEFCMRKSNTDKRVELIGAFHFDEKRNGHAKDSEAAFESRFEAFVNKPA